MEDTEEMGTPAQDASEEAIHATKEAATKIEAARAAQLEELAAHTAEKTKHALVEGLKEVFGEGDGKDSGRMVVLIRRIPILCTSVEEMRKDIATIAKSNDKTNDNIVWGVRIVIAAVMAALLKLVLT